MFVVMVRVVNVGIMVGMVLVTRRIVVLITVMTTIMTAIITAMMTAMTMTAIMVTAVVFVIMGHRQRNQRHQNHAKDNPTVHVLGLSNLSIKQGFYSLWCKFFDLLYLIIHDTHRQTLVEYNLVINL